MDKLTRLKKILKGYGSCLIAFSGGVDSTLLLKVASLTLVRENLLAVTADSPTYPREELAFAKRIARSLGVRHRVIKTSEFKDKRFISNPLNRCYFCKKGLFLRLNKMARKFGLRAVLDASTISDKSDFRPGTQAKRELEVRSPLQEAGLSKEDVRDLSRKLGLITWNKPSKACLASRVPYGTRISRPILERINKGEIFLRDHGFTQVRLRHYDRLCRIEVPEIEIQRLISKRKQIIDKFRKLGYNHITVDLEGYRSGSLNEVLRRPR